MNRQSITGGESPNLDGSSQATPDLLDIGLERHVQTEFSSLFVQLFQRSIPELTSRHQEYTWSEFIVGIDLYYGDLLDLEGLRVLS